MLSPLFLCRFVNKEWKIGLRRQFSRFDIYARLLAAVWHSDSGSSGVLFSTVYMVMTLSFVYLYFVG
jgi:hypothetical protein